MATFFKKTLSFLGLAEDETNNYEESPIQVQEYSPAEESFESTYGNNYDLKKGSKLPFSSRESSRNIENPRISRKLLSIDGAKDLRKTKVTIIEPFEFEEVQVIGDDLKYGIPVILNLQNTNSDLSKRIIDFCSGLTYALEGGIKRVADRVFLVAPKNILVSTNEKETDSRSAPIYNQH